MFNCSINVLDRQLSSFYEKNLKSKTESLRIQVLDSPTQYPYSSYDPTRLVIKTNKRKELIGLILMSWYMPSEVRPLVQLELGSRNFREEGFELGELLLTSKSYSLGWLLEQEKWNESDFFGNVLDKELVRIWNLTSFFKISSRRTKKYTGYCRGYQDSNRRAPSPLPLELFARTSVEEEEHDRKRRIFLLAYWKTRIENRLKREAS